jgi:hypothetical protein
MIAADNIIQASSQVPRMTFIIIPLSNSTSDMTNEESPHEMYLKEDAHYKNELAHQRGRAKGSAHPLCAICFGRSCHSLDAEPIKGNKSFKKSKHFERRKTKFIRNASLNPYFANYRNGEINV